MTRAIKSSPDCLPWQAQMLFDEMCEQHNMTYAEQAYHILDRETTLIRYNAEWLSKLTFADLIHLCSNFTVQQFIHGRAEGPIAAVR